MPGCPGVGPRLRLRATSSATRRLLRESAAVPVGTAAPDVDGRAREAAGTGLSPPDLALALARAKAESVAARHPGRIVLGADQVLDLDGTVFHKPADARAARAQLALLSGRTHALHSAVVLAGAVRDAFVETARLTLRPPALGRAAGRARV